MVAFTLAEVLITLCIIGIVAALTMPTLIANYQKKAQVIQIRKLTNDFVNAIDVLITEEGKTSMRTTSIFKSDEALNNWIKTKFSVTPCNSTNCFAQTKYKSIDKTKEKEFSCNGKAYLLANSAAVCIKTRLEEVQGEKLYYMDIYTDTNGASRPNTGGRDMFGFTIDEKLRVYYYEYGKSQSNQPLFSILGYNSVNEFTIANIIFPAAYAMTVQGNKSAEKPVNTNSANYCVSEPFGESCIEILKANNWVMDYPKAPAAEEGGGLKLLD